MFRASLLALALLAPAAVPPSVGAAPHGTGNRPPSPTRLRWEIIVRVRDGRSAPRVVETLIGSEALADARVAYWELLYPRPKYDVARRHR
jgi:hypothetical protein